MSHQVEIKYALMTFKNKPNTIGLQITGCLPPTNDEGLIDFVHESVKEMTLDTISVLLKKKQIKIVRNNAADRPKEELFLMYEFPFPITDPNIFIPAAERFIVSYYKIELSIINTQPAGEGVNKNFHH